MSVERLLKQPVTINSQPQPTGGTDDYGNPVMSSGSSTATRGYLEQQTSIENLDGRDMLVGQWVCYLPARTQVGPLDTLEFSSGTFQVDGVPEHCFNPRTGTVSHIRCRLTVMGDTHA